MNQVGLSIPQKMAKHFSTALKRMSKSWWSKRNPLFRNAAAEDLHSQKNNDNVHKNSLPFNCISEV